MSAVNGPHVVMIFDNVHMGLGHDGLADIAKKHRKDPARLVPGELLMFINRAKDKMKVYGPNQVIAYLRMPHGRRIVLEAIQYIPQAFARSGKIDYDAALKRVLEAKMAAKTGERRTLSPLEVHRALNA